MATRTKILISVLSFLFVALSGVTYSVMEAKAEQKKRDQERARIVTQVANMKKKHDSKVKVWTSEHKEWKEATALKDKCTGLTYETFDALDELDSAIAVGTNYDGYSEALKKVVTAYNGLSRNFELDCMSVMLNLEEASSHYDKAGDIWFKWYNNVLDFDSSETRELEDLPLQTHWDKGEESVDQANTALSNLAPGDEPVKPKAPVYPRIPTGK